MPTVDKNRQYRLSLDFTNQEGLKKFFKGTDITIINWKKIRKYNSRLIDIFLRINRIICEKYRKNQDQMFQLQDKLLEAYNALKNYKVIETKFNNNGRTEEDVYYNWMRGYLVSLYFVKVISDIFEVEIEEIEQLGEDNIDELISTQNPDIFKKEAIADLKIESKKIHIEVQSGFTGVNDIKKSKADDAKRRYLENGWKTVIVHFDLFRGLVAAVDITKLSDELPENQWKNNKQFENVKTTPIIDDCFVWRITEETELNDIITTIQ